MSRAGKRNRGERLPLPSSHQTAWGVRARSEKGPKPALSLERIVDAAVGVATADGLEAVSMGRVAAELGVATMSLYRYVDAKDELLALMMDAAFAEPPAPPEPREGWRRALSRWARAHLAVLRRNTWVVRIPISGPPTLPNQVLWFERGLACLAKVGLSERDKLSALLLVNGFVRNEALLTADLQKSARAAGAAANRAMSSYGRLLARLVQARDFPEIAALVGSGVFESPDEIDREFEFGLARILDGVKALMPQR